MAETAMNESESVQLRSWRWLLPCAAIPLLVFGVLKFAGGERCIEFMTRTQPLDELEMLLGMLYLLSYLAVTLVTPVCVLAALIIAIRDSLVRRRW